ncbi:MAG: extracellular solute-binding protein, partial [Anaerolineae bacterium]
MRNDWSISRRRFLSATGIVVTGSAAAAVLAACGQPGAGTATPGALPETGPSPVEEATLPVENTPTAEATTAAEATPEAEATPTTEVTPAQEGGQQIEEPITVRVWGFGLDDAFAQARVAVFADLQPNVQVEPVGGSLNTQQLLTAVASGDPPEVIQVNRIATASWAARNAIDPIDDLVERDAFGLEPFYDVALDQCRYRDGLYGIPQFVSFDLLYLNLDVLEEEGVDPDSIDPGNWEQLQQLGEQLHRVEDGRIVRTGFDTKMQDGRLWLWSWANGVDTLVSEDGQTVRFNDPQTVEALAWAKETVDLQGGEQARAAFQQAQNFFSDQNPVLIGQTVMTLFEQWLIGVLAYDPQFNFRTVLPRYRNSDRPLTMASGSAFAIPRGVTGLPRDAGWEFIKGMSSAESWIEGSRAAVEARREEGRPYTPTITGNREADQVIWNDVYEPVGPGYDQTVALYPEALEAGRYPYSGPVAQEVIDNLVARSNDALQGVMEPQEAMDQLQETTESLVAEFETGPGN